MCFKNSNTQNYSKSHTKHRERTPTREMRVGEKETKTEQQRKRFENSDQKPISGHNKKPERTTKSYSNDCFGLMPHKKLQVLELKLAKAIR